MATTLSVCPRCSARLQPLPENGRLTCPRCGARFPTRVSRADVPIGRGVVPPPHYPVAKGVVPPAGHDAESDLPNSSARPALWIALAFLGLLVFFGGGLALVLDLGGDTNSDPVAQTSADNRPPAAPADDPRPATPGDAPGPFIAGRKPMPGRPAAQDKPPAPLERDDPLGEAALPTTLSEAEQKAVNEAIDKGVAYLKKHLPSGLMGARQDHHAGIVPLIGLTLLECGVPADDAAVQQVTRQVRSAAPKLTATYSLSLAILFLDRLKDEKDRPLIQAMAVRLMAGQNAAGGWSYQCPLLSEKDTRDLIAFLDSHSPRSLMQTGRGGPEGLLSAGRDASGAAPLRGPEPHEPALGRTPGADKASSEGPQRVGLMPREKLSGLLQNLPVVRYDPGKKLNLAGGGDNSNTQFATLGVWAARRHGVPVDRTLAMISARFHGSQNKDGSWGYHVGGSERRDSMTCAGLLGLAVGRVVGRQDAGEAPPDPAIEKGLQFLGKRIGQPAGVKSPKGTGRKGWSGTLVGAESLGDLYFLWSVERVGMLYNLSTIGGKDWYAWGAALLVGHQNDNGSWSDRTSIGGILADTCFALLFLKRVNVAKDLTRQLQLIGTIRDPELRK